MVSLNLLYIDFNMIDLLESVKECDDFVLKDEEMNRFIPVQLISLELKYFYF